MKMNALTDEEIARFNELNVQLDAYEKRGAIRFKGTKKNGDLSEEEVKSYEKALAEWQELDRKAVRRFYA